MPKEVSEIPQGNQFSRSGGQGTGNDSHTRVFRVILNSPSETFNPETDPDIAVKVGDKHPFNDVYCTGYSVRFEGDSRLVLNVTLEYGASAGSSASGDDPNSQPPEVRPANWTTSTSLIEQPVYVWRPRQAAGAWGAEVAAVNPAGDIYEAVSQLTSLVSISITQSDVTDPTRHNLYGGYINDETITLGTLVMLPHTVMFRGVSSEPVVENWGGVTLRRWRSTYEFAFKRNRMTIDVPGGLRGEVDVGWDIVVPQAGYNVICFDPAGAGATQDPYGQPLQFKVESPEIKMDPAGPYLPDNLAVGAKARAMVRVSGVRLTTQAPSASPIPLNDDGTPRKDTATPKVLTYAYQVQPSVNITTTLGLRLY